MGQGRDKSSAVQGRAPPPQADKELGREAGGTSPDSGNSYSQGQGPVSTSAAPQSLAL